MRVSRIHVHDGRGGLLRSLGLSTLNAARAFRATPVKNHHGIRDVLRATVPADDERTVEVFVKRNLKPIRRHSRYGLLRYGRWMSSAAFEWRNLLLLASLGVGTCAPVAYGEEFGPLGETFSFIVTEAARGTPLDDLADDCHDPRTRRRVAAAVARLVRRVHDAGRGNPGLYARHVFVELDDAARISLALIDVDRLPRRWPLVSRPPSRDLARLHLSVPATSATPRERLRFLRDYAGGGKLDRRLLRAVIAQADDLARRKPNLAATYLGTPHLA